MVPYKSNKCKDAHFVLSERRSELSGQIDYYEAGQTALSYHAFKCFQDLSIKQREMPSAL